MKSRMVWVEQNIQMQVIRIFKSKKQAFAETRTGFIRRMWYEDAVGEIRHQCFVRSKGFCEICGSVVTETSGQLHEQKHRGKGGEISLENSIFVCAKTHKYEHRDRNPQWTKGTGK